MRVYVLHLDGSAALARAFDHVLESQDAASCMIEPELQRIRFLAPVAAVEEVLGIPGAANENVRASMAHEPARILRIDDDLTAARAGVKGRGPDDRDEHRDHRTESNASRKFHRSLLPW